MDASSSCAIRDATGVRNDVDELIVEVFVASLMWFGQAQAELEEVVGCKGGAAPAAHNEGGAKPIQHGTCGHVHCASLQTERL